jgi:hypothetical protein
MTTNDQHRYPWGRFYFGAWLTNPTVLFATLKARGMAVDLLALAYCSERPGYLVLQGKPMTPEVIARLRGLDVAEVKAALVELARVDLFDRDKKGVWCCPQMLADLGFREGSRKRKQRERSEKAATVTGNVTGNVTPPNKQTNRQTGESVTFGKTADADYQRKLRAAEEAYANR